MNAPLAPAAVREKLAKCRAIVGGTHDPLNGPWQNMAKVEREFWLKVSRLPLSHANRAFSDIPGNDQCALRNNLYRAAKRAEMILHSMAAPSSPSSDSLCSPSSSTTAAFSPSLQ